MRNSEKLIQSVLKPATWHVDDNDPEHQAKLPLLLQLRRELNSPEFKEMIQAITGCGPLSSTVDLSADIYAKGGHLLCHDDVISTRKVSYIVYLGEPDKGARKDEDGGRLQSYASDGHGPRPGALRAVAALVLQPHGPLCCRAACLPLSRGGARRGQASRVAARVVPRARRAAAGRQGLAQPAMRGQAHDAPFYRKSKQDESNT